MALTGSTARAGSSARARAPIRPGRIAAVALGLVFAAQPLVVFLASYHPGDCDDKAVHFFSAMYWTASAKRREQFHSAIEPFVRGHRSEPAWWRTKLRLRQAGTYPLANLAIAFFHRPERHFGEAVRYGLLAVAIVAELAVIAFSSRTPFGLWPTLLVLELIAFHAIGSTAFIGNVPQTMHPFAWHAPRAAAALLIIPVVLTFAAGQSGAFVASLVTLALLHAWLGAVCAALAVGAVAVMALVTRYDALRPPHLYTLLALGLFGGTDLRASTCVVGPLLYWCGTATDTDDERAQFDRRALVLTLLLFFIAGAASALLASQRLVVALRTVPGFFLVHEVPVRLAGVRYSLLVLGTVLAVQLALRRLAARASWAARTQRFALPATVALLVAVPLAHRTPYERVLARHGGFFTRNCPGARAIPLPEGLGELSLRDEPTLFLSFGEYMAGR